MRFTHRDGVGLDKHKVAVKGAKYDFETAECTAPYTAVIEWSGWSDDPRAAATGRPAGRGAADGLAFGGRTTRGYGRMAAEIHKKVFHFPADLDAWLAFDPDTADAFADADAVAGRETVPQENVLCAELRMTGSFIVRRYTSDVAVDEDKSGPDYCALENGNGRPGAACTGWAGRVPPPHAGHAG